MSFRTVSVIPSPEFLCVCMTSYWPFLSTAPSHAHTDTHTGGVDMTLMWAGQESGFPAKAAGCTG